MDPILQQLYNGDLRPRSETADGFEQFAHCREYYGQFIKDQVPELEKKFNVLMDDLTLCYRMDTERMFYQGFGLAVKLFAEAAAL